MELAIGVDVGGSGIKAGAVDLASGRLVGERVRIATPNPSTPDAVVAATARLVARVRRAGSPAGGPAIADAPVGIGIPSVVIDGTTRSAANIDAGWVDYPAAIEFRRALAHDVAIVNDCVAAPGLLSEVSHAAALHAVAGLGAAGRPRATRVARLA